MLEPRTSASVYLIRRASRACKDPGTRCVVGIKKPNGRVEIYVYIHEVGMSHCSRHISMTRCRLQVLQNHQDDCGL